ncbi:MAG TPA: hypothetical protein ENN90_02775 [Mariniphaga anaerophila]|uniref:Uncharacterized protein n=1 Tax=Mariniphaga anaerophila TaxID=1484053 RepID=A0A831LJ13_9BACT|nr:hypothetical protein [Mariniphaga anaerophila]
MNRTVTPEETKKLFEFCREHFVPQYDLQVELVDHMASSIEEQWKTQPDLPFDKALGITFKKFGVYGFSRIKNKKQRELRRRYRRLLFVMLKDFYRWPKIILTLLFTLILFTAFRLLPNDYWALGTTMAVWVVMALYSGKVLKKHEVNLTEEKRFMLLDFMKEKRFWFFIIINLPNVFINIFGRTLGWHIEMGTLLSLVVSFALVWFTFLLYLDIFILPKKIKEHFMKQFSEFAA